MPTSSILPASFAGSCYPAEPRLLLREMESALAATSRPSARSLQSTAYIVPHIDFRVNLALYANVYRMIAEKEDFPEVFVILGVGHRCPHDFSLCPFRFETPLGRIDSDTELLDALQRDCPFPLSLSPSSFRREHSLEFVIVWLQALRDLHFPGRPFRVLPVLMGGLHGFLAQGSPPDSGSDFFHLGRILKEHLDRTPALVIASIDGCHVGPRFDHDFAGTAEVRQIVQKWEKVLWSRCRSDRFASFFEHAAKIQNAFYFDGMGVLSLLLQHFNLKATRTSQDLWYEEVDQSFVTFSGGWFDNLPPPGTQ